MTSPNNERKPELYCTPRCVTCGWITKGIYMNTSTSLEFLGYVLKDHKCPPEKKQSDD